MHIFHQKGSPFTPKTTCDLFSLSEQSITWSIRQRSSSSTNSVRFKHTVLPLLSRLDANLLNSIIQSTLMTFFLELDVFLDTKCRVIKQDGKGTRNRE